MSWFGIFIGYKYAKPYYKNTKAIIWQEKSAG